jgi:tRNA (cytidine56-2'-O)-methyltransferase
LGADEGIYTGEEDPRLEKSIRKVTEAWGGCFNLRYEEDWKRIINEWKKDGGETIHLTMYGLPVENTIGHIRRSQCKKLIAVGGSKIPAAIYEMVNWNISVTSQPHSEISALSIFLHELLQGKELQMHFKSAKARVIPQAKGKKVVKIGEG